MIDYGLPFSPSNLTRFNSYIARGGGGGDAGDAGGTVGGMPTGGLGTNPGIDTGSQCAAPGSTYGGQEWGGDGGDGGGSSGYYKNVTTVTGTKTITTSKQVPYEVEQDLEDHPIPICRPKFIFFRFENLRPNTAHWMYFDGREVTKWVNTSYNVDSYNSLEGSSLLLNPGEKYVDATAFPTEDGLGGPTAASGPLYTSATGSLEGVFYLQSNTSLYFHSGVRMLSALDISVYDKEKAFSYAEVPYEAIGLFDRYTKQIKYRTETTTSTVNTYGTTKVWVSGGGSTDQASWGSTTNYNPAREPARGTAEWYQWFSKYGGP